MHQLQQYRAAEALEQFLGDPADPHSVFSLKAAVELDEQEEYPEAACDLLNEWSLDHYYIPKQYGGKLDLFEELFTLIRMVARRDLTVAIAHAKTFLGSMPVWVGGNDAQKQRLARIIKQKHQVALGLTERTHGGDLLSNDLQAHKAVNGYRLHGEKWLINNATRGKALTLFARTESAGGLRGFSLFLVEKPKLATASYTHLPKVRTLGIRGADISGICFDGSLVTGDALIGGQGLGFEIIVRALQVTRSGCASLSLGAADTALRITMSFALGRKLYGNTVFSIPQAQRTLVDAFADLLICECVSATVARGFHVAPGQCSVWSTIIKYFVPTTVETIIRNLSVVLGARYYLREAHGWGAFQKLVRDNAIVSLFDGSTIVNLQLLTQQLPSLLSYQSQTAAPVLEERLVALFRMDRSLPMFDAAKLTLFNQGRDDVVQGLDSLPAKLTQLRGASHISTDTLASIVDLVEELRIELRHHNDQLARLVMQHDIPPMKRPEMFECSKHYCVFYAASACVHLWLYNRDLLGDFFARGEWLVLCLHRLLLHFNPVRSSPALPYIEHTAHALVTLYQAARLFSLIPIQLVQGELNVT